MGTSISKVYLSGGLKSDWQERVMKEAPGLEYLNPQSHGLQPPQLYTLWDMYHVRKADIVFGYMERDNPSGYGLATEIGYAKGLDKTIILVDEKSAVDEGFRRYFAIVRELSDTVFESLDEGIAMLKTFQLGRNNG
jgi:hypothetical protein